MECHRDPAHIQAISVIIVIVAFIDSVIIRAGIYALLVLWVNGKEGGARARAPSRCAAARSTDPGRMSPDRRTANRPARAGSVRGRGIP